MTILHQVMEDRTVEGNFSKLMREAAQNVKITLTGILLKVHFTLLKVSFVEKQKANVI